MIVKDEEELLPRSLAAVAPYVDEIVIVDTGSTDGTVEIATSFGAQVIDFPWNGSFADARNVSLDAATGDWILWLDADEVLDEGSGELLREVATRSWREGFYLRMTSVLGDEDADGAGFVHQTMRLFRNRPEYRFVGRIHEQHTGEMPLHIPERFEVTDVHVLHYGYGAERVAARDKGERNTSLLELEAAENDGDPFTLFNLGTEHLAAGRPLEAAEVLATAWVTVIHASGRPPQYLPSLATQARAGAAPRGRARERAGRSRTGARDLPGSHRHRPRGRAFGPRQRRARARRGLRGDVPRARRRARALRGCDRRRHVPRARPARLDPLGPAPLRRGGGAARAVACRVPVLHAGPRRTCGRRGAARRRPPARGGRLRQARRSGCARRGRATQAWRPRRSRCTSPGATARRFPSSSAPAALASLDRLLELQEFDAFESLAVVWHSSPLPERDRRELLAGVYMARGFLDSAAEEWLAVAAAEPTAPALAGLARVAHARGLADDARVLLDEALRLDPSSEEGRALRDVLAAAA